MTTNPATKREPQLNEELIKMFPWTENGFLLVREESDWLMPGSCAKFQTQMRQFSPEDICVCSMARSGTTLMTELAWLVASDVDLSKAKDIPGTVKA
ncbi:uncharacterized protein LOC143371895 isoform X2 [Andrena cerasifolii]|uniref:uncharacterized protein LOC143371895 isoform X2 n=1 Tax=Andrena cerasifolii TaxID=2819439 RepID=UPI00403828BB